MKESRASRGKSPKKKASSVSRAALEAAALRYLERFDCTTSKLKQVLDARVRKASRAGDEAAAAAPTIIAELLERYQSSGLIDDQRFAQNFARSQRDRGASKRMIEQKLRSRGVSSELASEVLVSPDLAGSELEAARTFARRRRLGPHRTPETRAAFRHKDLIALGRAGFDYDTATRVVGNSSSEDEF